MIENTGPRKQNMEGSMTDRQALGVIVRAFGVYFFTCAVRQVSDVGWILLTSNSLEQTEHFPLPGIISLGVAWLVLSFVLIRYADWIVRVAYEWTWTPTSPSDQDSMLDAG
jgi:hypothetical protein